MVGDAQLRETGFRRRLGHVRQGSVAVLGAERVGVVVNKIHKKCLLDDFGVV